MKFETPKRETDSQIRDEYDNNEDHRIENTNLNKTLDVPDSNLVFDSEGIFLTVLSFLEFPAAGRGSGVKERKYAQINYFENSREAMRENK